MTIYYIIQLDTNKYLLLNEDYRRLDKTGKEIPHLLDGKRAILTLGQLTIFIKKQKESTYVSFIKFKISQIANVLNECDILSNRNREKLKSTSEEAKHKSNLDKNI